MISLPAFLFTNSQLLAKRFFLFFWQFPFTGEHNDESPKRGIPGGGKGKTEPGNVLQKEIDLRQKV